MLHSSKQLFVLSILLAVSLLVGCSQTQAPVKPTVVADQDMIGAIHAAGDREKSVIDVNPLREIGRAHV